VHKSRPRLRRADCLLLQQAEAPHLFMALALPFLQAVLKKFIIPNAPLLNFMRALAYGFVFAGAIVCATFVGWLLSDRSRYFNVLVPALCARMQLKTARPLLCRAPRRTHPATPLRCMRAALITRSQAGLFVSWRRLCVGCSSRCGRLVFHPCWPLHVHQPFARRNWARRRLEASAVCSACLLRPALT